MPRKSQKPTPGYLYYRVDAAHIASSIERRRRDLNLSMQQLADRAGVSPTTVMKLEHGEITVQLDKFLQILDQLNLPLTALFGFEANAPELPPDPLIQEVVSKLGDRQLEEALMLIAQELKREKEG